MGIKSFDFFRKLNTDNETSTVVGGLLTLIAFLLVTVLVYSETKLFLQTNLDYQAVIDNDSEQYININIDITAKAPCLALSLDQQDEVGVHRLDVGDTLNKIRLTKNGKAFAKNHGEGVENYKGSQQELDDLIFSINEQEQCRFFGSVKVNKVPGNFHISYHAQHQLIQRLYATNMNVYKKMKLDHVITSLTFGDNIHLETLNKWYNRALYNYFKKFTVVTKQSPDSIKQDYEYHIKALPARFYDKSSGNHKTLYKYAMTQGEAPKSLTEIDSIYFRYQISPINMVYDMKQKNFYHFLVSLCAIIGGVIAVIGILNSVLQKIV